MHCSTNWPSNPNTFRCSFYEYYATLHRFKANSKLPLTAAINIGCVSDRPFCISKGYSQFLSSNGVCNSVEAWCTKKGFLFVTYIPSDQETLVRNSWSSSSPLHLCYCVLYMCNSRRALLRRLGIDINLKGILDKLGFPRCP